MSFKKFFVRFTFALLVVGAGFCAYMLLKDTAPPEVAISPGQDYVSPKSVFVVEARDLPSGLKFVNVLVEQENKRIRIFSRELSGDQSFSEEFTLPSKTFSDGKLTVVVEAADKSYANLAQGNKARLSRDYILDSRKPRIDVESRAHNLNRGGAGLVVYTLSEDVSRTGVRIGDTFFPGYSLLDGKYACMFAFPYFVEKSDFLPKLNAVDKAGNVTERGFFFHANDRKFRYDTIRLPDSFLAGKMPQFEDEYPNEKDMLQVFLKVNSDLRVRNREELKNLGRDTAHKPLWSGRFLRLKNSKSMARFGDVRDYVYNGKKVDRQTHLGIDLASVHNAPVEAANSGRVIFAGFYGIYGNAVIIDHGLGLQTLYSHLSQIGVETGDEVQKGDIIGRTGATGMAGGDHLHFGVLISGIPVNPVEWWDSSWVENNIDSKLRN